MNDILCKVFFLVMFLIMESRMNVSKTCDRYIIWLVETSEPVIERFDIEVWFDDISWRARTELKAQFYMLTSLIATCLEFYIVKKELETPAPIEK